MKSTEEIYQLLLQEFGQDVLNGLDTNSNPATINVNPFRIADIAHFLHTHEQCYFDMCSCITGMDNGPEAATMEVIYTLYSIPFNLQINLKATLDRNNPVIDSVASVWRTADWHEREIFDLFGIEFNNHPDLRRILLPADWKGHPLLKDYEHEETYRGITIKY